MAIQVSLFYDFCLHNNKCCNPTNRTSPYLLTSLPPYKEQLPFEILKQLLKQIILFMLCCFFWIRFQMLFPCVLLYVCLHLPLSRCQSSPVLYLFSLGLILLHHSFPSALSFLSLDLLIWDSFPFLSDVILPMISSSLIMPSSLATQLATDAPISPPLIIE